MDVPVIKGLMIKYTFDHIEIVVEHDTELNLKIHFVRTLEYFYKY